MVVVEAMVDVEVMVAVVAVVAGEIIVVLLGALDVVPHPSVVSHMAAVVQVCSICDFNFNYSLNFKLIIIET